MFIVYDPSGRIMWAAEVRDMTLNHYVNNATIPHGARVIEYNAETLIDPNEFYINTRHSPRTAFPRKKIEYEVSKRRILANVTDETTISNLPNPVNVRWPNEELQEGITGGEISFSTNKPGFHLFLIESVEYLPETIIIEANIDS